MAIGNIGKTITFEVNDQRQLTFSRLTRNVKGRWATHNVIGGKPKMEFLGAECESISLNIKLSAMHGVKPLGTLNRIHRAIEKGRPGEFVLGGTKIGANKWVIISASEVWGCIYSGGELVEADLTLMLQEYA